MKALVRKELGEALVPAICLFVPLSFFWFAVLRTRDVLMEPQKDTAIAVMTTAVFAGLLLGYCQFASERWRKTIGYVLHRGTSDAHVFAAKIIGGLCATALIAIGPPLEFALWHKLTAEDSAILQMQRIVELGWLSAIGFSAYGLGALAAQLHRAWWKEICFALVGAVSLALIAIRSTIMTPDDPAPHAARFVAIQLAIGGVLLAAAFRLFTSRGDRDLPLPVGVHAVLGLIGIVSFIVPLDFGATVVEKGCIEQICAGYPTLVRERATNRVLAVARVRDGWAEVDASGRPIANAAPVPWPGRSRDDDAYEIVYRRTVDASRARNQSALNGAWQYLQFLDGGKPFSAIAAANGQFILNGRLDLHAGVIHVFFNELTYGAAIPRPDVVLPRPLPMEVVIEKPRPNRRFSGHTVCLSRIPKDSAELRRPTYERPPTYQALCAVDFDDRSMWRIDPLDLQAPAREVTLPDGDHFVRLESAVNPGEAQPGFFSPSSTITMKEGERTYFISYGYPLLMVVAGEHGLYAWNGERFERFERDQSAFATADLEISIDDRNAPGLESYIDPIEPSVEVRNTDGSEVVFRYDYGPRSPRDHVMLGIAYVANVFRSPLACVMSYFKPSPSAEARERAAGEASVPLLYGGHRSVLLLVVLAIAFLAARRVVKLLAQQQAHGWIIGVWTLLISAFGAFAYLLFLILEPRRQRRSVTNPASSSPVPLLIESRAPDSAHAAAST